ncbi:Myelin transcription factor 1-like protein, partial [Frankliniella fusca]
FKFIVFWKCGKVRCFCLTQSYPFSCVLGVMEVPSLHGLTSGVGGTGAPGEDLNSLEAEISQLQRENARVESQMLRLRTDITAMEAHLRHDKEPQVLAPPRASNFTDYYENLRNNVMTLLEHVRIPGGCSNSAANGPPHHPYSDMRVGLGPEHFDSYLSKLQTLCEEGNGSNRTIYGSVRSTLPTPI